MTRDQDQAIQQQDSVNRPPGKSERPPERGPSLLGSSGITGSMTLVSRFLGLARDIVIARLFGASDASDVFFLANKIPNFLRRLFAEGAFNQAFVPVLSEYRSLRSHDDVRELIAAVAASLGGLLTVISVVVMVAAPLIAVPIAYGFTDNPAKFALFVDMLRITFPYLLLISLTALCGAVLNSYGRFAAPAVTPALLNICLIGSAFLLAPYLHTPELALAWGVLIAGVAQLLFQLPFLLQMRLLPIPKRSPGHEGVARIKALMLPALFGVSVNQINLLLDSFIASLLVTGSVSWLYFSDRLMELPLGIFGVALAIVVLPSLSRSHADKSPEEFSGTIDWALRLVCLIAFPAALALILLAKPLLITLFFNDNFTATDVQQASASLQAYAFGLLGFMSVKIFAPGFYARQDTRTPVRIGVIAMVVNMLLNVVFYWQGYGHVGLAAATSLAACVNAGLLLRGLIREGAFGFASGWGVLGLRLLLANVCMGVFLYFQAGDWSQWFTWGAGKQVLQMAILVCGGVTLYVGVLFAAGLRWREVYR
ncbi:MAG: murein biosynthesis integral membrane protein MurJ [Proteobacteria bacterium]|nr:murein biosynthesis integral membrane protein MurJ [Pseudomonadota bacterium]MDA0896225.1 murein biosynthesis integral membrane protein MurJ [Pseudomonadota bacterium]MDA1244527.1 murein biosynthesis integral membrane protein MurJ [Pseudomonadota bacterium]